MKKFFKSKKNLKILVQKLKFYLKTKEKITILLKIVGFLEFPFNILFISI